MSEEITQEDVDIAFKAIKEEWDSRVKESGVTQQMYIALDKTGSASNYLAMYQQAKEQTEKLGLVMPVLIKGLKVTIEEDES